jgi:hypothetical protein
MKALLNIAEFIITTVFILAFFVVLSYFVDGVTLGTEVIVASILTAFVWETVLYSG